MTGKVLTRQLNGKTETWWDLNTRPSNTAKVTLHLRNYAYTKYTKFHVATAEHRVTDTRTLLKYTLTNTETG